jgi:hypothetical protein
MEEEEEEEEEEVRVAGKQGRAKSDRGRAECGTRGENSFVLSSVARSRDQA